MALFNLLPIPPLDGYRILSVWLPPKLQDRNGVASLIGLFLLCILLPFIPIATAPLFISSDAVMGALGISEEFFLGGWYLFDRWYTALPLLVVGLVYLIYQPASTFQLAGLVLEKFSPQAALKNYDSAIKLESKSAWSWKRKALTLEKIGDYEQVISAYETATQLDPHNRFLRRGQILRLMRYGSYEQRLKALDRYIEFHPKDAWGWGAKASTLNALGRDEEAIVAWEKNIELDSNDHSLWRMWMKESTLERLRRLKKL
jgi:tetratricopeptide (TPR) repeat protein